MKLLILLILSCTVLTGLIWTVQLIHYPAFSFVAETEFKDFHFFHTRKMTFLVLPLMLLELLSSLGLLIYFPDSKILMVNLFGLAMIWLSTFALSVPLHSQLSRAKSKRIIQRLVWTNWPRTILWSGRSILLLFFLEEVLTHQGAFAVFGLLGKICVFV